MKTSQNPISVDVNVLSGIAVFAGTRVPVDFFFRYIQSSSLRENFTVEFPSVSIRQLDDFLEMIREKIVEGEYENKNICPRII